MPIDASIYGLQKDYNWGETFGNALLRGQQLKSLREQSESAAEQEPVRNRLLEAQAENAELTNQRVRDENEQRSVVFGAMDAKRFLERGDIPGLKTYLEQRIAKGPQSESGRVNGMNDTQELLDMINTGATPEELSRVIDPVIDYGRQAGILKNDRISGKTPEQIDRELDIKEESNQIRREELGFRMEQGEKVDLSPTTQKILDTAQTTAFKSGGDARELELLAQDFLSVDVGGGVTSTTSEKFKALMGSQEAVSDLRRRFRAFRASQAVTNLPPGIASDKDIELALSGFPQENANNESILSFLKGQAKLARLSEAYHLMKADLISTQGDTRGLAKEWNKRLQDKDFQESLFSGIQGIDSIEDTSTRATFPASQSGQSSTSQGGSYTSSSGISFTVE